jgi:hypothetical protein
MPEEINRVVTDSITNWFFTTSEVANGNLRRAGVTDDRIFFVGEAAQTGGGEVSQCRDQRNLVRPRPGAEVTIRRTGQGQDAGGVSGGVTGAERT